MQPSLSNKAITYRANKNRVMAISLTVPIVSAETLQMRVERNIDVLLSPRHCNYKFL
jgi:hypothetical protein